MNRRSGVALLELLTTITILGLMAAACAGLIRAQAMLLRHTSGRAAAEETIRAARAILRADLRDLTGSDLGSVAADSITARVFRGFGIACAEQHGLITLRYRGVRQPDAGKDSLLVLGDERTGTIRRISAATSACATRIDEQLVAIEPDIAVRVGSVVLFFERGGYHVAAQALRYRRGASGLQPITDDLIDDATSGFAFDSARQVLRVTVRGSVNVTGGAPAHGDTRIRFRN